MYSEKFEKALSFVKRVEGGWSNNSSDKGGKTNFGITELVYLDWQRKVKGVKSESLKMISEITQEEVRDIYWDLYWEDSRAEDYCYPLALVMMDTAVNFGVDGMVEFLQESFGMKMTGIWGDGLSKKMEENNTVAFALKIIDNRIKYRYFRCKECESKGDPSQWDNYKGWINRDNLLKDEVLKESKAQMDITKIQSQGLVPKVKKAIIQEIMNLAKSYVQPNGESMEIEGNNWGGWVTTFLKSAGINYPAPWCNAFTSYVVENILDRINYMDAIRITADTWTTDTWGREKRIIEYDPQEGDLALFYWGATMPFHIGFVENTKSGDSYFGSIEGNTNAQGSSEGNTVARKTRPITDCKFVRWINLVSGDEVSIRYKGKEISRGVCLKGSVYAPIRELSEKIGSKVEYIKGIVYVNNKPIHVVFSVEGNSWGKVRNFIQKDLSYDNKLKVLTIGD